MISPERRPVDVEWRAFRAGIKPALRVTAEPGAAAAIAARYERGGASVATRNQVRVRSGRACVVYVARSPSEATALQRAEQDLLERASGTAKRRATVELGRLLGYPTCCVQAFVRRNHGGVIGWLFALATRKRGHDAYLGARDARVAQPYARINPLLMPEGRALISFDPCRYDCARALSLANRHADLLTPTDGDWVKFVERELARSIAVDANGARAHVQLERARSGWWIAAAHAPRDPTNAARERDLTFASALVGRVVGRGGLIRDWPAYSPPVVIDFSAQMA